MNKPRISVVIPTHDMVDKEFFLRRNLDALWDQTMQDFEIVVSDNSDNDLIEDICHFYDGGIRYFKNPIKGMAQNTNFAIQQAKGELIKILYLDDYLAHDKALQKIWDSFKGYWLVTGCEHQEQGTKRGNPHVPTFSMTVGENTIGSPSVLTIKNDHPPLFDESMTWLLDDDYYRALYMLRGAPTIINDINVVIGTGKHQASHILSDELKRNEYDYLLTKHQ